MGIQPSGNGAIIPFASGSEFEMRTTTAGDSNVVGLIGFGANGIGVESAGTIDISVNILNPYQAFSVPRNGTITSISALFSVVEVDIPSLVDVTLTAQLYSAPPNTDEFTAIPSASVVLATDITEAIPPGDIRSDITNNLNIPVLAETRLLMVFFTTASTGSIALLDTGLTGFASAGVNIV
ncbi:MAG: hypothetical protein K0Q73_4492 [Paenibacillus sp.]|jgi:BclB C-terminal domain-containing protein|nr:hypothetical protein [Paenibacillus sp.]